MPPTVAYARAKPASLPNDTSVEIDFQTDVVTIPVRLCNLPPFNAIASQVLALTADPEVDLGQISRVIQGDPAFAADILFLANSSLFGFPSRMHSLSHAIALLGLERIKALGVTVAMRGFLGTRTLSLLQCWQHSAACALVCEEISAIFEVSRDRAYTAGILHDIGRLGLLKTYGKEMASILKGQHASTQEVLEAEREALHVDHARAGSWLVDHWCLPQDFSEICEHHHDAANETDSEILQLVKAACRMADAIGFPAVKCQRQPSFEDAVSLLEPRRAGKAAPSEDDLRAIVTARLAAFER
jgi:HD-like signal output (HDOD) protein